MIGVGQDALASACSVWTFAMVEERMIEAVRLWWRSPGRVGPGSGNPFARDIPAQLIVREAWLGDYDARGGDGSSSDVPLQSAALSREDVEQRDRVSEWMIHVPDRDRALVHAVLRAKASGRRVDWLLMRSVAGVRIGADGVRRRYCRSIEAVLHGLNRVKKP